MYTFWFDHGGFFEVGCAEPFASFRIKWDEWLSQYPKKNKWSNVTTCSLRTDHVDKEFNFWCEHMRTLFVEETDLPQCVFFSLVLQSPPNESFRIVAAYHSFHIG